jgi:hypothetical protein
VRRRAPVAARVEDNILRRDAAQRKGHVGAGHDRLALGLAQVQRAAQRLRLREREDDAEAAGVLAPEVAGREHASQLLERERVPARALGRVGVAAANQAEEAAGAQQATRRALGGRRLRGRRGARARARRAARAARPRP